MELSSLTIAQIQENLAKKAVTSKELTNFYLEKINQDNEAVFSYLHILNDEALRQAEEADKKIENGEGAGLIGVPLAIKDNIMIHGFPATAGSRILENYIAPYDASVIRMLKKQGAVFLGKTNMDEFAMGSSTENSAFGSTKNPRDLERVPGGSSGGSAAAVSAEICAGALGSDTGGSISQPASFCGVVGFKPSYGRVSRYGLVAMASSLDQIGPLTKTVEDSAIIFDAIDGDDPKDSTTVTKNHIPFQKEKYKTTAQWLKDFDVNNLTIGVPKEYFSEGIDTKVKKMIEGSIAIMEKAGAKIKEVSLPHSKYALAVYYIVMPCEVSANLARFDGIKYGFSASADNLLETYLKSRHKGFGAEVRRRVMLGTYALSAGYYDAYYLQAQKVRTKIKDDFKKVFAEVDVLFTPTSPTTAFKFGEKVDNPLQMYLSDICTVPVNLAGLPALSIPAGEVNGLPVGLQIIGAQFHDEKVLQVGHFFEIINKL